MIPTRWLLKEVFENDPNITVATRSSCPVTQKVNPMFVLRFSIPGHMIDSFSLCYLVCLQYVSRTAMLHPVVLWSLSPMSCIAWIVFDICFRVPEGTGTYCCSVPLTGAGHPKGMVAVVCI